MWKTAKQYPSYIEYSIHVYPYSVAIIAVTQGVLTSNNVLQLCNPNKGAQAFI